MSEAHDRKFIDLFSLVVGILFGVAAIMYFFANYVAGRTQRQWVHEDSAYRRDLLERIAPIAKVAIAGHDNSALTQVNTAPAVAAVAVSTQVLTGEQVYSATCNVCHAVGLAGAPKFKDSAAWGPRIQQGLAVLHKHALEGYQGKAGVMPAKGGRADLSEQSVVNAVDYMVNAAK